MHCAFTRSKVDTAHLRGVGIYLCYLSLSGEGALEGCLEGLQTSEHQTDGQYAVPKLYVIS